MAKRRIMQTMPHNSPGTLVLWSQRSRKTQTESPQQRRQMQVR